MEYALGIDVGTTACAAATTVGGRPEIFALASGSTTIPSVVFLDDEGQYRVGQAAASQALARPDRITREFKRRMGDTVPIFLGGAPHSPEFLTSLLLKYIVGEVGQQQGDDPASITVTHPANWGAFKRDQLAQSFELAGLRDVTTITEPEAAAVAYALTERVDAGEHLAVYDLGGGTFDVAVLRRTDNWFEIVGAPAGIERLGGIDFDAAVLHHVAAAAGGFDALDDNDPHVQSAMVALLDACRLAKESLSSETTASIPVRLPGINVDVRLTRAEFESMIEPSIRLTTETTARAIESAQLTPSDLRCVLLVGGSSRVPLISQVLSAAIGAPIATDAHPKHPVALGAATVAWSWHHARTPPVEPLVEPVLVPPLVVDDAPPEIYAAPAEEPRRRRRARGVLIGAGIAAVILAIAVGALVRRSNDGEQASSAASDSTTTTSTSTTTTSTSSGSTPTTFASDAAEAFFTVDGSAPQEVQTCPGLLGLCIGAPVEKAKNALGLEDNNFDNGDGVSFSWQNFNGTGVGVGVDTDSIDSIKGVSAGDDAKIPGFRLSLPEDGVFRGGTTVSELVADRGAPTEATTIAGEGTYLAIIRYRIGGEGSIDLEFVTSATFDELPNGPGNTTDEILSNFGSKAIEGVDVKLPSGP